MNRSGFSSSILALLAVIVLALLLLSPGCASYATKRDKTKVGAGIGAAAGAVLGATVIGEGEADEILAGAAVGAGIGAGVGAYMDRQEEQLARIPNTTVERVGDNMLLLRFQSDVLFEVDSSELEPAAQSSVDQVAEVMIEYKKTAIVVQGHTDSSGSEAHNQSLSERRAGAVRAFLIGNGIDPDRITAVGYGESQPVASNDYDAGRRANRRVDMLLKAKAR